MDFLEVASCLANIAGTGSKLHKEQMLRVYGEEVPGFKEVLKFIFDPYFTTGLKAKKLLHAPVASMSRDTSAEYIMDFLRKNNSGTEFAAAEANRFIYEWTDEDDAGVGQWAATGLVTKDLQIGVSVTTLNKVYGEGFIPKVGIMRGMLCPEKISGTYIATEKIDGNRRIIMNKPTGPEIYTRSGHRDVGLVEIEKQVRNLPIGFVYDTECIAVGDFADSLELRQASASILNSRGKRTGVKALVFDMMTQTEYDSGKSKMAALFRKYLIAVLFGDLRGMQILRGHMTESQLTVIKEFITKMLPFNTPPVTNILGLPILDIVTSKEEGLKLAEPIWETGGEGVMLVDYMSPYEVNPNPRKTLLKIKATEEFECECIGVYEGENKLTGTLGGIELLYVRPEDPNTYVVRCGSGFNEYMRDMYWKNPSLIIGKMIEGDCFGETRNAQGSYSLNCPIFKRIKGAVD